MCLSTVFLAEPQGRRKVCEYVSAVRVEGERVVFTDIMGQEREVAGVLRSLDLVNNEILVEAKGA